MTTRRCVLARLRGEEDGQLLLLVLCYTVIAALLVTVVVNLSRAYLYRRGLVAAADGAALSAANQPDLGRVYTGAGATLPISESGARAAVAQYAVDAELAERFNGFDVVAVSTDGQSVTVTFRASVRMPFLNLLSSRYAGGYPVEATATARSPFAP
jgi:putative Flp pilus-assembly TadE/G-like protein